MPVSGPQPRRSAYSRSWRSHQVRASSISRGSNRSIRSGWAMICSCHRLWRGAGLSWRRRADAARASPRPGGSCWMTRITAGRGSGFDLAGALGEGLID